MEEYWKSAVPEVNPLNYLLQEEMPAVATDKAKLMELMRRRDQCITNLENENMKLQKLRQKREKREEEERQEKEAGRGSSGGKYQIHVVQQHN